MFAVVFVVAGVVAGAFAVVFVFLAVGGVALVVALVTLSLGGAVPIVGVVGVGGVALGVEMNAAIMLQRDDRIYG